jgi:phosphoribosyl-AMP cyclohydrolase / phosphoribosyl-ATP pyrophosphohydrolase
MQLAELRFDRNGFIPTVVTDAGSREVLMIGPSNRESLEKTLESGYLHLYSNFRRMVWLKGETSGHFHRITAILATCDLDGLEMRVLPEGPSCRTGSRTCLHHDLVARLREEPDAPAIKIFPPPENAAGQGPLEVLFEALQRRRGGRNDGSYATFLFEEGRDRTLRECARNIGEVLIASKNEDQGEVLRKTADLFFHFTLLMVGHDLSAEDFLGELERLKKRHLSERS